MVASFAELVATPFAAGVNAVCWPRVLDGNFGEVVRLLGAGEEVEILTEERLRALPLSASGTKAVAAMMADLERLRGIERDPLLNCVRQYPRDEEPGPVRTDVFSFHADGAPVEADTFLCTYFGPASEGLPNEEAVRRVDLPEVRGELRRYLGAEVEDEDYRELLREHGYDLHYAPLAGAVPYSFGLYHLWRIAIDWPGSSVPPCIHRAPETATGDPPRLLLIS